MDSFAPWSLQPNNTLTAWVPYIQFYTNLAKSEHMNRVTSTGFEIHALVALTQQPLEPCQEAHQGKPLPQHHANVPLTSNVLTQWKMLPHPTATEPTWPGHCQSFDFQVYSSCSSHLTLTAFSCVLCNHYGAFGEVLRQNSVAFKPHLNTSKSLLDNILRQFFKVITTTY